MGLLQKACETYDCHASLVGLPQAEKETLAPVSHILTSAQIEITVDQDGQFQNARAVDKSEPKIVIPVTEESGGRSGTNPKPHPLCDQLKYLAGYDAKKYEGYVAQLTQWTQSPYGHPKLQPILHYVKGGTILRDLERCGVIHLDEKGRPREEDAMVRWRVVGLDDGEKEACWADQSLFRAFIDCYRAKTEDQGQKLCMISGTLSRSAVQHPKGIAPVCGGNAKLISSNDSSGFTYRGRFAEDWQAATVSYEASQKAHSALRWLAANQGTQIGGRVFLCWNPQGKPVRNVTDAFRKDTTAITNPTEYKEDLRKTLLGYRAVLPDSAGVVIAAFDAATTGRLSLTYYNELMGSDFLQRLHDWDATCCWPNWQGAIWAPSLYQIVNCTFGTVQNGQMKTDNRVLKQQIQRLVFCRVDRARLPSDIKDTLARRASNPQSFEQNRNIWREVLFIACAVLKKYDFDRNGEEWNMALDPGKQDRSYQFGRLLAVMEKAERDTYGTNENREPNAIRQMSVFWRRPMYVTANLEKQLEQAYLPKLNPGSRVFYKNMIGQIMEEIDKFPENQQNRPLEPSYLMGYYLQRSALYQKKENEQNEEDSKQ